MRYPTTRDSSFDKRIYNKKRFELNWIQVNYDSDYLRYIYFTFLAQQTYLLKSLYLVP